MAYLGLTPITQTLATSQQFFSGDGSTRQFTLQQSVGTNTDVVVLVGSVPQIPTTNYTANGTALIFTSAPAAGTNNISVTYLAGALNTTYLSANSFPLGTSVAPSIAAVGAATTGLYWPSTTSLAIVASGNVAATFTNQPTATNSTTGALRVSGGLGVSQAIYAGGVLYATSGTASTASTNGALVVTGGLGVSGDQYLGGSMTISGGLTVAGSFNTTATNSLVVNDPFLFLANTNVGNSVDIGTLGTYNDGKQRYTGFYRAQSDGVYRVFANLTVAPTTLVTKTDASFQYADLWMANANVTSQTASTTSTSGALQVMGGIGARGSFYLNSVNNSIAIGNGGTSGTGSIGASGAIFGAFWGTTANFNNTVTVNSSNQSIAIANGGTNGSGDIGATGAGFGTVWAKATSAQYADVAEKYSADAEYAPGTVVSFGGEQEVTQCNDNMSSRVAGIVSTNPAYMMNNGLQSEFTVMVALLGRVPCKVHGQVRKGDLMVSAGNGYARSESNPAIGTVLGKALENFDGLEGVIEVVVGRV